MNKKVLIILLIAVIIILVTIYIIKNNSKNNTNLNNSLIENKVENSNTVNNSIGKKEESGEKMSTTIKVNIDNKTYTAKLEQNETAKKIINMLPQEFNMNELNGNEKYVYLDTILPTN